MEKPVKKIKRGHFVSKEIDYRAAFLVTLGILFICVLFSAFQSAYIFRLNCGREGIMSYADILNRARKEEETGAIEFTKVNVNEMIESVIEYTWFSKFPASEGNVNINSSLNESPFVKSIAFFIIIHTF